MSGYISGMMPRDPAGLRITREMIKKLTPRRGDYSRNRCNYDIDDPIGIQQLRSEAAVLQDMISDGMSMAAQRFMMRVMIPYCFTTLDSGLILPLNREYKPLGIANSGALLDYARYENQAIPADRLEPHWKYSGDDRQFWLYADRCAPWHGTATARTYLVRLKGVLGGIPEEGSLLAVVKSLSRGES